MANPSDLKQKKEDFGQRGAPGNASHEDENGKREDLEQRGNIFLSGHILNFGKTYFS